MDMNNVVHRSIYFLQNRGFYVSHLVNQWNAPPRTYHTVDFHLKPALSYAEDFIQFYGIPPESSFNILLHLYLWYHDAVYVPGAPSGHNEFESHVLMRREQEEPLRRFETSVGQHIEAIAATTNHRDPERFITAALIDIDLAGLGSDDYHFNSDLVMAEYGIRDPKDPAWVAGRTKFLRSMLERPNIYYTSWGARFESRARQFMEESLNQPSGV